MTDRLYKTIELENNQTLEIYDASRKIAADAYVVTMKAQMEVLINKTLFVTQPVADTKLADIRAILGDRIVYNYKIERNMIMADEKDAVMENLVETFINNTGQYVCKSRFPEKLVLKEYRERIEKKNKYR